MMDPIAVFLGCRPVLASIFDHLSFADLEAARNVSKGWRTAVESIIPESYR